MRHSDVAHRWAQQDPKHLRGTGSRMFFEHETIYSHGHHWVAGKFTKNARGQRCALVNARGYTRSVSTATHTREVRGALEGGSVPFFEVDDPTVGGSFNPRGHLHNATVLLREAAEYAGKAKRARKDWNRAHYAERAEKLASEAQRYARFFGILSKLPRGSSTAEILANLAGRMERDRKALAKKCAADHAAMLRADAESFALWQAGTLDRCPYTYATDKDGSAFLRLAGDHVDTSRGARVPREHAERAVRAVLRVVKRGTDWRRGVEGESAELRIGDFLAESIKANGETRIGCHLFTLPKIKELARVLGIPTEEPNRERASVSAPEEVL